MFSLPCPYCTKLQTATEQGESLNSVQLRHLGINLVQNIVKLIQKTLTRYMLKLQNDSFASELNNKRQYNH